MRVLRVPHRAPLAVGLTAAFALSALAWSPASAGGPADPPRATPASGGAPTTPKASADEPISVADVPVPAVDGADRRQLTKTLANDEAGPRQVVAYVRRPVVHDFSLLGVVWDHSTDPADLTVLVRTRSGTGAWGGWTELDIDPEEGPSVREMDPSSKDGTEPVWVSDSTGVEVAVYAPTATVPTGLEVSLVDPGTSYDVGSDSSAPTGKTGGETTKSGGFPVLPHVVSRKHWGADPSLGDRCWSPKYGKTFKAVIVHHTAGSNSYSRAEAPAVVRGIYAYHTQARDWCDIGYNFLVDKYGTVYEGRRGGIRRSVRGAHAGDYNVDTTGISVMGNYQNHNPSKAVKRTLVSLISWRLGSAYHGAYGRPYLYNGRFNRISGHRDVMSTSCPGQRIYDWMPRLRKRVAGRLDGYESKIERAWRNAGGKNSRLGVVKVGEQGDRAGRHTTFTHGRMYASAAGLRTLSPGPVLTKYVHAGETGSGLGYPRARVWTVGKRAGEAGQFVGGRIYWSSRTGAKALVRSPVLKEYLNLHGASGRLGFPRSPVVETKHGRYARFQQGVITHDRATGRTTVTYS